MIEYKSYLSDTEKMKYREIYKCRSVEFNDFLWVRDYCCRIANSFVINGEKNLYVQNNYAWSEVAHRDLLRSFSVETDPYLLLPSERRYIPPIVSVDMGRRYIFDVVDARAKDNEAYTKSKGRKFDFDQHFKNDLLGVIGEYAVVEWATQMGLTIDERPSLRHIPDKGYDLIINGVTIDVKCTRYIDGHLAANLGSTADLIILVTPADTYNMTGDYSKEDNPMMKIQGWVTGDEFNRNANQHPRKNNKGTYHAIRSMLSDCEYCPRSISPMPMLRPSEALLPYNFRYSHAEWEDVPEWVSENEPNWVADEDIGYYHDFYNSYEGREYLKIFADEDWSEQEQEDFYIFCERLNKNKNKTAVFGFCHNEDSPIVSMIRQNHAYA